MIQGPNGPLSGLGVPGNVVVVEEKALSAEFDANVQKQIQSEVRNIKAEYAGKLPEESIDRVAGESIQRLASSRVPQFVPLFVGRFTRERLRELVGAAEGQTRRS
jgi:hypothetical protein